MESNTESRDRLIASRLDEVLELPQVPDLVAVYFDDRNALAGADFDTLGRVGTLDPTPDAFTYEDLLAMNLLGVPLKLEAIRRLMTNEFESKLAGVQDDVDIWDATQTQLGSAQELRKALRALPGVGHTTAAKLCAHKRPRFCPIYDSVVDDVMGLGDGEWYRPIGHAMSDSDRLRRIEALTPASSSGYVPHPLRITDAAIWMLGSSNQLVEETRIEAGLSANPWRSSLSSQAE